MINIIILIVVSSVFLISIITPRFKLPQEMKLNPILSINCTILKKGTVFNSVGLPYSSRFTLYDSFIVISDIMKTKVNYSGIQEFHINKRLLFPDNIHISIHGDLGRYIIYSNQADKIYAILESKVNVNT